MNGMSDLNDLVYLQVRGKNQLFKEIEECQGIENKVIDHMALHRNEITNEYEAMENEDKPKAYNRKLKKKSK